MRETGHPSDLFCKRKTITMTMTATELATLSELRGQLRRVETLIEHHQAAIERDLSDLYAYGYRAALLAQRVFLTDLIGEIEGREK
jgi:hypothetical protein